jgi:hypothetical protein
LDGGFVAATFQTKGYVTVDERMRGAADVFAGARNSNLSTRIGKSFGEAANIFLKTFIFRRVRANGTGLQTNRTASAAIRFRRRLGDFEFGFEIRILKFRLAILRRYTKFTTRFFPPSAPTETSETLNRVRASSGAEHRFIGQCFRRRF